MPTANPAVKQVFVPQSPPHFYTNAEPINIPFVAAQELC
jgi:hypothetical protein